MENRDEVNRMPLGELYLDAENPRFGQLNGELANQTEILDHIVATFGVDDVLSSLAVNGYFDAEPLVCRQIEPDHPLVVCEGNRRLAACLILTGEERARNQRRRTEQYQELHRAHNAPTVDVIPVIVIDSETSPKAILSYLGVRHIASAQQWDSFAKAVWIERVVNETDLNTEDIAQMIGDRHQTVRRLLEGYKFMQQLVSAGRFFSENSVRKGRGSNTSYPFSWVYTILGYSPVRTFLQIEGPPSKSDPVPEDKLDNAVLLASAMFGDRSKGRSSALRDSRQLGELAMAVSSPQKVELLRQGKTLSEIELQTMPLHERLAAGLLSAKDTLRDLNNRLTEQDATADVAQQHTEQSEQVKRLATAVDNKLREAAEGA